MQTKKHNGKIGKPAKRQSTEAPWQERLRCRQKIWVPSRPDNPAEPSSATWNDDVLDLVCAESHPYHLFGSPAAWHTSCLAGWASIPLDDDASEKHVMANNPSTRRLIRLPPARWDGLCLAGCKMAKFGQASLHCLMALALTGDGHLTGNTPDAREGSQLSLPPPPPSLLPPQPLNQNGLFGCRGGYSATLHPYS